MLTLAPDAKTLVLGTALWGWGVPRESAWRLLDLFVDAGGRVVDTATNYPINQRPADCGLALDWISAWRTANSRCTLSLIVKIGACDNLGGAQNDLSADAIARTAAQLADRFGSALACIAVHWDSRSCEPASWRGIDETAQAFADLHAAGYSIGFSGVVCPQAYLDAQPQLADQWIVQVKENATDQRVRRQLERWFAPARYLAYGINMGGIKSGPMRSDSSLALRGIDRPDAIVDRLVAFLGAPHGFEPAPTTLNQLALAFAYATPGLSGVVTGPRTPGQLKESLAYWQQLNARPHSLDDLRWRDRLVAHMANMATMPVSRQALRDADPRIRN